MPTIIHSHVVAISVAYDAAAGVSVRLKLCNTARQIVDFDLTSLRQSQKVDASTPMCSLLPQVILNILKFNSITKIGFNIEEEKTMLAHEGVDLCGYLEIATAVQQAKASGVSDNVRALTAILASFPAHYMEDVECAL